MDPHRDYFPAQSFSGSRIVEPLIPKYRWQANQSEPAKKMTITSQNIRQFSDEGRVVLGSFNDEQATKIRSLIEMNVDDETLVLWEHHRNKMQDLCLFNPLSREIVPNELKTYPNKKKFVQRNEEGNNEKIALQAPQPNLSTQGKKYNVYENKFKLNRKVDPTSGSSATTSSSSQRVATVKPTIHVSKSHTSLFSLNEKNALQKTATISEKISLQPSQMPSKVLAENDPLRRQRAREQLTKMFNAKTRVVNPSVVLGESESAKPFVEKKKKLSFGKNIADGTNVQFDCKSGNATLPTSGQALLAGYGYTNDDNDELSENNPEFEDISDEEDEEEVIKRDDIENEEDKEYSRMPTVKCIFYKYGHCWEDNNCTFVHDDVVPRLNNLISNLANHTDDFWEKKDANVPICPGYIAKTCWDMKCELRHVMY